MSDDPSIPQIITAGLDIPDQRKVSDLLRSPVPTA